MFVRTKVSSGLRLRGQYLCHHKTDHIKRLKRLENGNDVMFSSFQDQTRSFLVCGSACSATKLLSLSRVDSFSLTDGHFSSFWSHWQSKSPLNRKINLMTNFEVEIQMLWYKSNLSERQEEFCVRMFQLRNIRVKIVLREELFLSMSALFRVCLQNWKPPLPSSVLPLKSELFLELPWTRSCFSIV